jgi:hypothetical protein
VVTLFNAIRNQQKVLDVGEGATGPSAKTPAATTKRITLAAKDVPKQSFLSLLKSSAGVGLGAPPASGASAIATSPEDHSSSSGEEGAGAAAATASNSALVRKRAAPVPVPGKKGAMGGPAAAAAGKKRWAVLDDDFQMKARSKDWRDDDSAASEADDE